MGSIVLLHKDEQCMEKNKEELFFFAFKYRSAVDIHVSGRIRQGLLNAQ